MPAEAGTPVLLWAAGGIVAAVVVIGVTWAVWPSGKKEARETVPAVAAKSDQQPPAEQSVEAKPTTTPVEPAKSSVSDAATAPAKTDSPQATASESANPVEPVAVKTAKPADAAPPASAPVAAKTDDVKANEPPKVAIAEPVPAKPLPAPEPKATESASTAPDHSPVLKFDPLNFDVDRLGSSGTTATSSIPIKPPGDAAAAGAVGNEDAPVDAAADPGKQPAAEGAIPLRAITNGVMVRRGPPGDAAQHLAAQVLALRVKSFQVTDMPLVRFVDTMSGVAGTGITLDPLALEQVGISPQATVSVNAQDEPLRSILHDGLAQRRLDIAEQGGQLRVVLPKADESHTIDYDAKDLATGTDAAAVGKLIEHFVAPATWKSAGGKGTIEVKGTTLHIEQSDAVRRQVVVFCERLRMARSLAVQSKYPSAMLSIESPYHRLSAKLEEHATFTFLPWTRLDDVVRNWQELSGLAVFVDWGALAEAELGPSSPVACSANDRSWQEALDGVLEPLGLGWWAVNGETIQITSLTALERIQRVEFYEVPAKLRSSFAGSQALVDALQKELTEATGKLSKAAPAHLEIDEPSGRLVVLATPGAHRQLSRRLGGEAK
jgi:hypothetical protein